LVCSENSEWPALICIGDRMKVILQAVYLLDFQNSFAVTRYKYSNWNILLPHPGCS